MNLLLGRALALSIMFHAYALAYFGTKLPRPAEKRAPVADLSVLLREQPKPAPPPVEQAPPPPPPQVNRSAPKPRAELRAARKPAVKPKAKPEAKKPAPLRLPYPLEAVARGLEGDVMVRVVLDGDGNVVATQLFQSSGHALLDDAAVAAARNLRGLPDNMPRESVLPVRFRLK